MVIKICGGQNCKDYGGEALAHALMDEAVPFEIVACQSLCSYAPVAFVSGRAKLRASLDVLLKKD